jgi:hypothetical protein
MSSDWGAGLIINHIVKEFLKNKFAGVLVFDDFRTI